MEENGVCGIIQWIEPARCPSAFSPMLIRQKFRAFVHFDSVEIFSRIGKSIFSKNSGATSGAATCTFDLDLNPHLKIMVPTRMR